MRDLQRLAPDVLAGVLPRLYPQMLEIAYEHQDAGRPIFICTAASQEMAELMAIVLTFDGAVGSRRPRSSTARTPGRAGGPFTYREGKAQAIRELAEREGIDLARLLGVLGLGVRPADAARGRPSRRGQPGQRARARRPRGGLGDRCASTGSAGGCAWPARRRLAALAGGLGSVAVARARAMSLPS